MPPIFESDVEELVIKLPQEQGFDYLTPEQQEQERQNLGEVEIGGHLIYF